MTRLVAMDIVENCQNEAPQEIQPQVEPCESFKPDIIGGQDLTSLRAHFDRDNQNIIVASNRQLLYFNVQTCQQNGQANIPSSKFGLGETFVASEMLETNLYLFTNHGKFFIWNIETKDWVNELCLPIDEECESLVSCKMLSKRQYIFSVLDHRNEDCPIQLYCSMSRSERERPKQRELLGSCSTGKLTTFDIGCVTNQSDLDNANKTTKEKLLKQRCLAFIDNSNVYFQKVGVGEKLHLELVKQSISGHKLTCVRANSKRPMIAVGDTLGRIYIYIGNFNTTRPWSNRTKFHWHSLPVNDLCFSSTGKTLYSVGGESGCLVIWDLAENSFGQKKVISSLGMPIRHINCSDNMQQLILSFEDNEIQFMNTDRTTKRLRTFTRRTYDMYKQGDFKALRFEAGNQNHEQSDSSLVGLLWHSKTDSLVTNAKTGWLQFYSPKQKTRLETINCLKSNVLSLEQESKVLPSEITRAALSPDGDWLALYETREFGDLFPEVKLHIWQRTPNGRWFWIQTADRLHNSASIVDLRFSSDSQFLVSVSDDGTFIILHRICLDAKSSNKQMYAKGFVGNVSENMPSLATFSRDSSVLAISLKNNITLIWMIVDPYKLVYECELNQIDSDIENNGIGNISPEPQSNRVLGLHFGQHDATQGVAPLCEVRSGTIRIWNVLNAQSTAQESMIYSATNAIPYNDRSGEFTSAAFDECPNDNRSRDHFAVTTRGNLIYIFELKIAQTTRRLHPLIVIDGGLTSLNGSRYYTNMIFLREPILEIDEQCYQDPQILRLINRLCLISNQQELIGFTDKLTIERQSAINNCNEIKSYEMSELQAYFSKNVSAYRDEIHDIPMSDKHDLQTITEKQRRIKHKLEVQRMLKDLFHRIPSHNLPRMDILGPMILDKLIIK